MRVSPHRRLLVAVVMAAIAAPVLSVPRTAVAAARAPQAAARYSRLPAPRIVQVKSLPPLPSSAVLAAAPFRPRSTAALAAAKRAAVANRVGRRSGVVTTASTSPSRAAAPRAAQQSATASGVALQVGPSFPTTSMNQQVSWFNPSNDQTVTPPDTQLAPGPISLLMMTNSSASIWSKTGTLLPGQFDLYAFYGVNPATDGLTDPRVVYDAATGRWFASAFSFSLAANSTASKVHLAVSLTGDPAAGWSTYVLSSNPSLIQDQPKFALTSDKLVITWNDFNGSTTNPFVGEETRVVEKTDLLLAPPLAPRMAALTASPDPQRYNLVPAQSQDGSATAYLAGNGSADGAGAFARLIAVTGTPAAQNVSSTEQDVAIAPTSPPPGAMQGAGGPLLATNDDAFISAAVRNGILWVAGNDACIIGSGTTTRACARLIQISLQGRPAAIQDVDLGDVGAYFFFPAVAIDGNGNLIAVYTASSESSYAGVGESAQAAGAPGTFVSGYLIHGGDGAYSCGSSCATGFNGERWGDYSSAEPDPASPGDVWVAGEYGTQPAPPASPSPSASASASASPSATPSPTPSNTSNNWGTAAGRVTFTPSASLKTAVSSQQYELSNSDGKSWAPMDPDQLSITITPATSGPAIVDANADLWTANAGYNQDLGISVSPVDATAYPDGIVAWKESGGFAGTFSPNAAYVQGVVDLTAGTTYSVTLKWKTNKSASGASIFAGAGVGPTFSPTRLSARLVESGSTVQSAVTTSQYMQINSDGVTWVPVSPPMHITIPADPTSTSDAIISGNADLWTATAGVNQDLGILIDAGGTKRVEAWKESGGRSGTFSPNAAFVQTVVLPQELSLGLDVSLVWKANKPALGSMIMTGAGLGPQFSPTRLTVELVPDKKVSTTVSNDQYSSIGSDGQAWLELGATAPHLNMSAPDNCLAIVSVNVDLWTATAGVNQDVAIAIRTGSTDPYRVIAWKESGGSAGTFSPNAAFLETVVGVQSGHSLEVSVRWKSNFPTGGRIFAAAGNGSPYSPTRATLQWVCS